MIENWVRSLFFRVLVLACELILYKLPDTFVFLLEIDIIDSVKRHYLLSLILAEMLAVESKHFVWTHRELPWLRLGYLLSQMLRVHLLHFLIVLLLQTILWNAYHPNWLLGALRVVFEISLIQSLFIFNRIACSGHDTSNCSLLIDHLAQVDGLHRVHGVALVGWRTHSILGDCSVLRSFAHALSRSQNMRWKAWVVLLETIVFNVPVHRWELVHFQVT